MSTKNNHKNARRMRQGRQQGGGYRLIDNQGYTQVARPAWTFLDPHQYVTLKYVESITFTLATVTGTQQIWRMNSLFDPNSTGTGHQPYGFDQLANLYNRYRVLALKWKITYASTTASYQALTVPVNGVLAASISNATTFDQAAETPRAQSSVVSLNARSVIMRGFMRLNEMNGVTRTEYLADDRFEAQVGTSPAEVISLYQGWYNPGGSTITLSTIAELEYMVDFHDPVLVTQSLAKPLVLPLRSTDIEDCEMPPAVCAAREAVSSNRNKTLGCNGCSPNCKYK